MVPAVGCSASRGTRVTRTRLEAPPSSAPEADRSVALDRVVRLAGATYDISVRSRDSRHPVLLFLEDAQASRAVGSEQ